MISYKHTLKEMTANSIYAHLSFPPSANRMYRNIGANRTIMSKVYREWKTSNVRSIDVKNGFIYPSAVSIELAITPPDKRNRDLDNYIKPVLDVLEASGILENDNMVKRLNVFWQKADKQSAGVSCYIKECLYSK
jgi:crossover junction endodeoxyribonuclease RusA